jgi:predicted nucleic acid-binding protein
MRLYLDSSAIVKLVQREPESDALARFLDDHRDDEHVTSTIARVEVVRPLQPSGAEAVARVRQLLAHMYHVPLDADLLDRAAALAPDSLLRSLDAVHLASAQLLGAELRSVVTYDRSMASAAAGLRLPVAAPV